MHEPEIYKGHNTKDAKHWAWLQQDHGKPIYMQEQDRDVPNSVRYPLEAAKALAGVDMFTTTFAYMAALAIMQEYDEISIYGVELSATEYAYQANGYLFWFGFLRGRLGDKVSNAITYLEKNIFTAPYYGYEGGFAFGADYFKERFTFLDGQWRAQEKNLNNYKKAIERAVNKKEHIEARRLIMEFQGHAISAGETAGALSEAERYQTFGDRFADRGGFEFAAAKSQKEGEEKRPYIWHMGGQIEYVWNVWKQGSDKAEVQLLTLVSQMSEAAYATGARLGVFKENVLYINKYDAAADAGGRVLMENNAQL